MSPNAQRIAIAEVCGWRIEYIHGNGMDCDAAIDPRGMVRAEYPDYLHDLNAMAEAETVLSRDQMLVYQQWLDHFSTYETRFASWMWIHATAAQRAEAFLRSLNLWDDTL